MKTIKLRAYDLINKKMMSPFIQLGMEYSSVMEEIGNYLYKKGIGQKLLLMQWMGRKDLNNKEVYEFDEVRIEIDTEFGSCFKKRGIVIYKEELGAFVIETYTLNEKNEKEYFYYFFDEIMELEVIGYKIIND